MHSNFSQALNDAGGSKNFFFTFDDGTLCTVSESSSSSISDADDDIDDDSASPLIEGTHTPDREPAAKEDEDLGPNHPRAGQVWLDIGAHHNRNRDFAAAENAFLRAGECTEGDDQSVEKRYIVAEAFAGLGAVYCCTHRYQEAAKMFHEALKEHLENEEAQGRDPCLSLSIAHCLVKAAKARTMMNDNLHIALKLLRGSAAIQRRLGSVPTEMACIEDAKGEVSLMAGNLDKAMHHVEKAYELKLSVVKSRHDSSLVYHYHSLAKVHLARKEYPKALEACWYLVVIYQLEYIYHKKQHNNVRATQAERQLKEIRATVSELQKEDKAYFMRLESNASVGEIIILLKGHEAASWATNRSAAEYASWTSVAELKKLLNKIETGVADNVMHSWAEEYKYYW